MIANKCWNSERKPRTQDEVLDYAIVGGGIAGAYCAWRLKGASKHKNKKIVLFEYSNRIGGRLLTVHLPHDGLKVELGGMRYIPGEGEDQHPIFTNLVDRLGLQSEPFPMGYTRKKVNDKDPDPDPEGKNNYAYFRGKHLRISDFKNPSKVPFCVDWSEEGKTPDELQFEVMKKLFPGKIDDWFEVKVFGQHLWKYGLWNLLYRVLSPEAYLFFKYASGYDTNASNGNAVALLPPVGEVSSSSKYRTVKDGMMAVPCALCREFVDDMGGQVELNRRLISIDGSKDTGGYTLHFNITKTETRRRECTSDTGDAEEWKTRNVILALPKVALERIQWKHFQKDTIKQYLDSVLVQPAIKIGLEYEYAWWKALNLFRGRSISDLPLRQTYYFTDLEDLNQENPFEIRQGKHALMIASYSDIESVPFWQGLESVPFRHSSEGSDDEDLFEGSKHGYRASKLMVREAHNQVMRIHGQHELPQPCAAAYYDWGDPPFGGGWHFWKAGYRYDKIIHKIRQPVPSENVFICGEAYSMKQGWAEGALQTAEDLVCNSIDKADRLKQLDWVKTIPVEEVPRAAATTYTRDELESLQEESSELAQLTDEQTRNWIESDSKGRML
jgi:monoamine oxidase